ncbi:MAG TPA: ABC transporter ATP-binding protein [Spirochaetia bacterium]
MDVTVSGLTVTYDGTPALREASLSVPHGSIVGILGPSGSGKTTLIKCIVGLLRPARGEVRVAGRRVPDKSLARSVGYMAQEDALYPDLTGQQNLRFFSSLYGLRGPAAAAAISSVFRLTRLTGHESKRVKNYSGGMRKRLSLAAALVHGPSLLVLDEPTVGIDPVLRAEFWDEFRRLRDAGATILLTTHVMDEADRCDRLALVFEGRVLAYDTPAGVCRAVGASTTEEAFLALRAQSLNGEESHA